MEPNSFWTNLNYKEVAKLQKILDSKHHIHGKGNFPTIEVEPRTLIQAVQSKLIDAGIGIAGVILNGSAASHVISDDNSQNYKDFDIIFKLNAPDHGLYGPGSVQQNSIHPAQMRDGSVTCQSIRLDAHNRTKKTNINKKRKVIDECDNQRWTIIRDTVMTVLLSHLPSDVRRDRLTTEILLSAYVNKLIKINNENDRWSLVSLSNNKGRNLELKFVESMRRQFEFSVDSFQIVLDSYMKFSSLSNVGMNSSFFPQVEVHSVYGNIVEARSHLNNRQIVTKNPEEIRGGGLLRYCNLITRSFKVIEDDNTNKLQTLMCSRFFIDFPDIDTQTRKLESYLTNHFNSENELELRFNFLLSLQMVVDESTICLMSQERKLVLDLIMKLAKQTLATVLRGEGFKVVVQQANTSINSSTSNNVTTNNHNSPTQNGNSNQPRKNKKKNKKNRNQQNQHNRQVLHQPFPVMPFVTYSKIETTPPPPQSSDVIYQPNPPTQNAPRQFSPNTRMESSKIETPSSSGLSSLIDSDHDSINADRDSLRSDRISSPDSCEDDWNSNSCESSSGVDMGSLSGSRSPSPQKADFIYECNYPEAVNIH